ncbi:hypothetical protein I4U23_018368 [Adineta vaga]|nr:hypothetical protein I4U23_018368 [Adineta vaga]
MYFYELFSHSDRFSYRSHLISSATYVLFLCTVLTLLPPFLLTYYTGDFWLTESIYSEQPRLDNNTKFILQVDNDGSNNQFFLSSYSNLNRNLQSNLLISDTIFTTNDTDSDGLLDQYRMTFDIVFASTSTIRSINIWLIFQYELRVKQHITMETMALANFVPSSTLQSTSNQHVTIYGQLMFKQKKAIQSSGIDLTYNELIIDSNSLSLSPDLNDILDKYFARNYYTSFQTQYTSTTARTSTDTDRLTITLVMNVGRQAIRYMPGFWQAFKWGWIQYISVLLPFFYIFHRLKLFVFSNHLVRTFVPLPKHRHQA